MKALYCNTMMLKTELLLFLSCSYITLGAEVRPLEILVQDKENERCVSNVQVFYVLESAGPNHILGIPIIEPINYKEIVLECYVTDQNGWVHIPSRKVRLPLYQTLYKESVYINLDAESSDMSTERKDIKKFTDVFYASIFNPKSLSEADKVYCPNPHYSGVAVFSTMAPLSNTEIRNEDISSELYTIQWISEGLARESETINVKLKRHPSEGSTHELEGSP